MTNNQSLLKSTSSCMSIKRTLDISCEPEVLSKIKLEPEDSNDMIEDSTEFCEMNVGETSSAEEEVAVVKEEEISDVDSMMLDDTTQFILDHMLSSDSDSDSDFEINKRKNPKPGKKDHVSKSVAAAASTSNKPSRKPKQGTSHASTLKESECELCKKIFPSIVSLSKHYEMDHRNTERVFMCERFGCDEKLLTFDFLEIHKRSHYNIEWRAMTGAPMYHKAYCNICQLSSHFPAELRNHELEKHLDMLRYTCSTCGAKYFCKDILDAHTLAHSDSLAQLECPLCPNEWKFKFPDAQSFESHIIRMHSFPLDYVRPRLYRNKKYIVRQSSVGLTTTCDKCGKVFTRAKLHKCRGSNDHKCELCPMTSKTKGELVCHTIMRHEDPKNKPELKLTCEKCEKQFATTLMYKRHLNCHNLEMKFEYYCCVCEERFATENLFSTHKKNHHEPSTDSLIRKVRYFICDVCGKSYKLWAHLRIHERKEHPHIFTFCCDKCDDTFSKAEFLETHRRTHEAVGPYVCSLCPKKIHSTGQELETHLKQVHTVGFDRTCPTCGEQFLYTEVLRRHMFTKHGVPLPLGCASCSERFVCQNDLKNHTLKKHGTDEMKKKKAEESRRQCEICQKWYRSKYGLQGHIETVHGNAEVHVCEICGKSITTARSMKDHMKTHREEKNFACSFCDKRFVRKDALRMHTYTHTGEKPLACYICDKRFNQHTPLKKHIETHKKDGSWFPKPSAFVGNESSNSNNFQ